MINFLEVMERLTLILSPQMGKTKILDRDIARSLSLDPQYFAVIKRRNKIPYEALAEFCHTHKVSLNWLLLGQTPQYLHP